jgi:predicted phosphodiesterase
MGVRTLLRMKVAVISDIHANRHAFEATLEAVAASDASELWCLGDLVGYGAEPDACVELAREHAAVCLAGNHDLAVTGEIPLDEFSRGASVAAEWTREVIEPQNLAFLQTLSPQGDEDSVGLYHASPRDPVWEYVLSTLLAELCLDTQRHRLCLIGHSHVALAFERREGEMASGEPRRAGAELDIAEGEWLINPGSVGQPRDGDRRASWLMLDLDSMSACFHRADYDVAGAAAAIRAARLPDSLAERLEYGQ